MRLWHQKLIHYLPRQQLLGQHRECCALRGKGWGKKHSVVDYVFCYDLSHLYEYHQLVIQEMIYRKYHVDINWCRRTYRGKHLNECLLAEVGIYKYSSNLVIDTIYKEHNDAYLKECLLNLQSKGAELINGTCISEQLLKLAIEGKA